MNLLEVKQLTFAYDEKPVLENFSVSIKCGDVVKIDGVNGSGKTTLLKCMTSVLNRGRAVFVEGISLVLDKAPLQNVSFVMADDTLYDYLSVKENVHHFKVLFKEGSDFIQKVSDFYALLGMDEVGDVLVKNLSQGTRHKVYLGIMLSKNHKLLILDEPFTALDKVTQAILLDKVTTYKNCSDKALIMVTHIQAFDHLFTRVVSLDCTKD